MLTRLKLWSRKILFSAKPYYFLKNCLSPSPVGEHVKKCFWGTATFVALFLNPAGHAADKDDFEIELDDEAVASEFLPGTSADVVVVQEVRDRVLRIPTAALLEGARVLVPNDGTREARRVEIGLRNGEYGEVRSGLEDGGKKNLIF